MAQMPNSMFVDAMRYIAREWRSFLLNPTIETLFVSKFAKVAAITPGGQVVPHNITTVLTGWTVTFDVNGNLVASTGIFTARTAGYYLIDMAVMFSAAIGVASLLVPVIQVNGGTATQTNIPGAGVNNQSGSCQMFVNLNAGDVVTAAVFQNSGGPLTVQAGSTTRFNVAQIG